MRHPVARSNIAWDKVHRHQCLNTSEVISSYIRNSNPGPHIQHLVWILRYYILHFHVNPGDRRNTQQLPLQCLSGGDQHWSIAVLWQHVEESAFIASNYDNSILRGLLASAFQILTMQRHNSEQGLCLFLQSVWLKRHNSWCFSISLQTSRNNSWHTNGNPPIFHWKTRITLVHYYVFWVPGAFWNRLRIRGGHTGNSIFVLKSRTVMPQVCLAWKSANW